MVKDRLSNFRKEIPNLESRTEQKILTSIKTSIAPIFFMTALIPKIVHASSADEALLLLDGYHNIVPENITWIVFRATDGMRKWLWHWRK